MKNNLNSSRILIIILIGTTLLFSYLYYEQHSISNMYKNLVFESQETFEQQQEVVRRQRELINEYREKFINSDVSDEEQ